MMSFHTQAAGVVNVAGFLRCEFPVVTGRRRSSREHGIATGADREDGQGWFGDVATVNEVYKKRAP